MQHSRKLSVLIACFLLVVVCQAQAKLSGRVETYPNKVGAQKASLVFTLFVPVYVPGGSLIVINVPENTSIVSQSEVPCHLKSIIDVSTLCKNSGPGELSFELPNSVPIPEFSNIRIRFTGAFNAPLSTKTTDSFKIKITDSTWKFITEDDGALYLTDLMPNDIQEASISQVNSVTVGAPTAVYFSVTTLNPIPQNGGVQIRFPKWNPMADVLSRESFVLDELTFQASDFQKIELPNSAEDAFQETDLPIDYSKLCSPKRGVQAGIKCHRYQTSTYEYITLTNMFINTRDAGNTFQFYLSRLRNPISQTGVSFEITTFESIEELVEGRSAVLNGLIDSGYALFTAEQSTAIDFVNVRAELTTVQELSKFYFSFKVPVPLSSGCTVKVQLPDDFELDAGNLARIQGWGIFGRKSDLNFGIDESSRIIKIVDQCAYYSSANTAAELEIEVLKNPDKVKSTKSFILQVSDRSGKGIAEKVQGIFYKPTSGLVQDVRLESLGSTIIGNLVDMRLDFTPRHMVAGNSTAIHIKMPPQLSFDCTIRQNAQPWLKMALSCIEPKDNEFRLIDPFTDNVFDGKRPLSIIFSNIVLPGANLMIKGIEIYTIKIEEDVELAQKVEYIIDELIDPAYEFFAPKQQLFLNSQIVTASEEVFTETVFSLFHTLANNVPGDAIIYIFIPADIEVQNEQRVQESCTSGKNLRSKFACRLKQIKQGSEIVGHELWAEQAFLEVGLIRDSVFELRIEAGLRTPISTKTSETFKVIVYDKDLHEINYVEQAMSLTMKVGKDIGIINLDTINGIVGGFTEHSLTFVTPAPIYDGFLIIVHIPEEVQAPMNQHFVCQVNEYPLSKEKTKCRINAQRVTITASINRLLYPGERIAIGEELGFQFASLQNPGSTEPTSPYKIQILTEKYNIVAESHTEGPRVINTIAADIFEYQIEALDLRQLATTTITLTWKNTQVYPKDFALKIFVDLEEIVPIFSDEDPNAEIKSVPCVFRQTLIVTCQYLQEEPGTILVTDLPKREQSPDQILALTLTRQKFDIVNPRTTKTWQMEVYTDSSTEYKIERISDGLTFSFNCNLPCQTCISDLQPDFCLSCNQYTSDYLILYEGLCRPECPDSTFQEAYMCYPCDPKCKKCADNSGSTCTECFGGFSDFPFLYGNTCVNQCITGFFGNRDEARCETCMHPCATCTDNPKQCLSCKLPAPGEPIDSFFYENECLSQCPYGWVADEYIRSNVCGPCSDNCETCEGNKNQCKTCASGMKLNLLDMKCTKTCPSKITVPEYDRDRGIDVCRPCDSSCLTCSGISTFCTSCQNNLSLLPLKGTCKLDCDEQSFTQVSVNGECVGCSESCATCQITQDTCMSCNPGKYFHANNCVKKCPKKNGYQYEPNEENICIIPGLRCPFGYDVSATGDYCQLKVQICNSPDTLNYDKKACVPGSDAWFPFPLLMLIIIITVIVYQVRKKKPHTKFIANLIVFWSFIEFLGMWMIFGLAATFGISPVVYMLGIALLFSVATNLFFFMVFSRQVMNDQTFFHWANYKDNMKAIKLVKIVGIIFSFKVYRLFYSKFYELEQLNAPFADPYKFYTPLNLASFLNLLLVMLLSLIACIFTLYYVPWGYQLTVEAAEFLCLEIAMIVFYVIEYTEMKEAGLMKRTPNWQADAIEVDRLKVKSGYEDELSDDQDVDAYTGMRKELKPKALKTIHTMEKLLASLLTKKNALEGGYEDTLQEIEYLHERELMLRYRRRCMSFRIERPEFREAWGFESDENDEGDKNYISEPGSPRSKEMLQNQNFSRRMQALSSAYHMRDQYDNCYSEARDPSVWPLANVEQATKKLQTNVMELLGVDDLREDTQSTGSKDGMFPPGYEYEYDHNQQAFMMDEIIENIDVDNRFYSTADPMNRKRRGSDPDAENYGKHKMQKPRKAKRQRKHLTKRRMAELPSFTVDEILGEFEQDQNGNAIILQTANSKLNDKFGRMCNRRGYLIDPSGNVITRNNVFIFYKEEIDFDDEIPAPFCFRKQQQKAKFSVRNFKQHRQMRRKDKLAMQNEFIEKEYQKLKHQARKGKLSKDKVHVQSQQYSKHETFTGINVSEKAQGGVSTIRDQRQSVSRHDASGAPLLHQSDSSQLGDLNLSNIILQDREGGDYYVTDQKGSNRRKPPRNPSMASRKQTEEAEDDQFINEVTAPMKAKTKHELLGAGTYAGEIMGSPRSNRSRSNSKRSNSKRSSRKKQRFRITEGKMLNISSQKSIERIDSTSGADQHYSQAELMALPTAGCEPEDFVVNNKQLPTKNFDLDLQSKQSFNISSSLNFKAKKRSALNSKQQSRPKSSVNQQQQQSNAIDDEHFLKRVQEFNEYLSQRKVLDQQRTPGAGKKQPRATVGIIDDTFMKPDGSVRNVGLAHKNLNQVYGKVRTNFNKVIRTGSQGLKTRPNNLQSSRRVDDPHRIIGGMNQNQRERMLLFEINSLCDRNNDPGLATAQRRLNFNEGSGGEQASQAQSSPTVTDMQGAYSHEKKHHRERINELRKIYSDYRLNSSSLQRTQQAFSPSQAANQGNY